MQKRTTLIFSVLVAYVFLQFLWWEVLLVRQSNTIIEMEQKLTALSITDEAKIKREIFFLEEKKMKRVYMIVGEGSVFLLILLFGISLVRKSVQKETELANQQKNFILSVSHELKTPIAVTKLQLQTLLKHDLAREKQKELLVNAITETERLHKLVDNVLLANQIENNNLAVLKNNFDFSALVKYVVTTYFNDHLLAGNLKYNVSENIIYKGDKDLISSLVINLIENAVKYSYEKINITISLSNNSDKPLLEIKDSGCGIPEEEREKIFLKFYRSGKEDTRRSKGTGIGLYIVERVCELHNASIRITNNAPIGSIFKVQF